MQLPTTVLVHGTREFALAIPNERAAAIASTRIATGLVVGLALFTAFFELGGYRVLTDHEAYVGVPAREMLASGDWIVPRFGGVPRLEKPPLAYWLAASSSWLFGRTDAWVVRLHSTLATLGLALLMAHWAGRRFGRPAAIAAGAVQLTMGYVLAFGRKSEVDILLCLLTTSALYLVAWQPAHETGRPAARRWAAIHLLVGLSFLAKFHYGVAMVLGPVIVFHLVQRSPRRLLPMLAPVGLGLLAACLVIWPVLLLNRVPHAMTTWWHETVNRALPGTFEDKPWYFYGPHLVSLTMPWTPIALLAIPACWARAWRKGSAHDRFLWIWFAVQLGIMSLSANKHRHYLIAALPVFTLLAAETIGRWVRERRRTGEPLIGPRFAFRWTVIVAGSAWFAHEQLLNYWPQAELAFDVLATLATVTVGLVGWLLVVRRDLAAVTVGIVGAAAIFGVAHGWAMPLADHRNETARFAADVRARVGPHETIHGHGLGPCSAVFYLGHPVARTGQADELDVLLARHPDHLVTRRGHLPAIFAERPGVVVSEERGEGALHEFVYVRFDDAR